MGALQQLMMAHGAAGAATFPTLGVIDSFTRANEGPPMTGWTEPLFTLGGWTVDSNEALGTAGTGGAYLSSGNFGPDIEIYCKAIGNPDIRLYFRVTAEGTAAATGYFIYRSGTGGSAVVQVYRQDNGSITQLGTGWTQTFTSGDYVGAKMVGSTITVYYCTSGGSCGTGGAGWTSLGSETDSTYTGAGKMGIYGGSRIDDFGGGTI